MSMLREKNFVRPNVGVPYTTTAKNFVVAMETSKTWIFVLSWQRGIQKYIICLCYEKKNFGPNVGTYATTYTFFWGGVTKNMAWKFFTI